MQRTAYNRMSFTEWSVAFIYWLPGYGEPLAATLFGHSSYAKLGTDPGSYMLIDSKEIFDSGLEAVDGDRERLTDYLVQTEILNHPLKHAVIGIPLAWRGVLAGKYLAAVGLPCALFLLFLAIKRRQSELIILAVPAFTMVALYAAISASIPRYNVYLIYYYAISVAWAIDLIIESHLRKSNQPTRISS
jgi:hypothetical protein